MSFTSRQWVRCRIPEFTAPRLRMSSVYLTGCATVLLKIGFLDSENPEHMLLAFRRILGRAGLEDKDVRIFTGLVSPD